MLVYTYIVESNPDAAYEICKKYGFFNIESKEEMAHCLQTIVSKEGEGAFKDIMELHPDKEVIMELFSKKKDEEKPTPAVAPAPPQMMLTETKSADGSGGGLVNQTNTYILVAALIISVAIISMKK